MKKLSSGFLLEVLLGVLVVIATLSGVVAVQAQLDPSELKSIRRVNALPATGSVIGELVIVVNRLTGDAILYIYQTTGFVELGQVDTATFTTLTVTTLTATTATITTGTITTLTPTTVTGNVDYTGTTLHTGGVSITDRGNISFGAALAVVGASQTLTPTAEVHHVSAGAAADVTVIADPPNAAAQSARVTFICDDVNLTFTNADSGANTLDLSAAFTCSARDTITFIYDVTEDRWLEHSRKVN